MRYLAEWSGWPDLWMIRDRLTGRAYQTSKHTHFWHGSYEQAIALTDRLNR